MSNPRTQVLKIIANAIAKRPSEAAGGCFSEGECNGPDTNCPCDKATRTDARQVIHDLDAAGFAVVPKEPTQHMMQMVNDGPLCGAEHPPDFVWLRGMYLGYLYAAPKVLP